MGHSLDIPLVKTYCERSLINSLTVENVLDRFIFASRNGSQELHKEAKELIMKEKANITKTENWRELAKANSDVILELFLECI